MNWVEIVRLRSLERDISLKELWQEPAEGHGRKGLVEVRAYRHAALETDQSFHLLWMSEGSACTESDLGLRLAEALRSFGLVDHSLWIEEEGHVQTIYRAGRNDER